MVEIFGEKVGAAGLRAGVRNGFGLRMERSPGTARPSRRGVWHGKAVGSDLLNARGQQLAGRCTARHVVATSSIVQAVLLTRRGIGSVGFATPLPPRNGFRRGATELLGTLRSVASGYRCIVASLQCTDALQCMLHCMHCSAMQARTAGCNDATMQSRTRGGPLHRKAEASGGTGNAIALRATHCGRCWEWRCKALCVCRGNAIHSVHRPR